MEIDHQQILNLAEEGEWDQAHRMVQPCSDRLSCLIHAYLHRVEGDIGNAGYWYSRAGEDFPGNTLEQEFGRLADLVHT
jgi:hypothetical protein